VLVAILLAIIVLAVILAVTSLTAPPAKAPAVPPTPGPATLRPAPTATVKTPGPRPTATHVKKTALGQGPRDAAASMALFQRAPGQRDIRGKSSPTADPRSGRLAYFRSAGSAYAGSPLFLTNPEGRSDLLVGHGDALVRPVWSPDGRYLLYVRVQATRRFPGARWTLLEVDVQSRHTAVLAAYDALNLSPLGWQGDKALYLVANTTDSSVYAVSRGRPSLMGILMPQVLTTAFLSPDGTHIAFEAPANCVYCTLDTYDLSAQLPTIGPSGFSNESAVAWTRDGRELVAFLGGRLTVLDTDLHPVQSFRAPAGLPSVWSHLMRASVSPSDITLVDSVTGQRFLTGPAQR
jgi:Tol biopolymer transport system component